MPDGGGSIFRKAIAIVIDEAVRQARTIVVGKISAVARQALGELDVDFDAGVGTRQGAEEKADGTVPSAPVLYPGGGGWSVRWPLASDDEAVAIVSDRNIGRWRQTKIVGQAHSMERHHALSDSVVLPFRLTPPTPTPPASVTDEDTDFVIQGPLGDAIRLEPTGPVTIRKGPDGATLATISIDVAGTISLTVPTGQTVKIGDASAEPLVIASALMSAMSSMLAAGAAVAPTPMAGNNGSLAFLAGQTAWNTAIGATPLGTIKAWGV